jgi:heavy metal sensor kinase
MSRGRRVLTVRARLTLWNLGVMLVVLAVYAAGVLTFVKQSASHALDERVRSDFSWASEMWEQRPDGTFTWFEGDHGQEAPWLTVWGPRGEVLHRTRFAEWYPIDASAELARHPDGRIVAVPSANAIYRVLSGNSRLDGRPVVIQVARSESSMRLELRELLLFLGLGLPLAVVVAGAGGYVMARHALAPVERMAERARSITADRLSDRLPVDNPHDEFGRLASVFNDTLGRLESSFGQMQRFTSDVSHELRTPLTAIRSVGEVGLRERRDERAYREIIGSMLEEADRLVCLVARILTLSRVDSGQGTLSAEVIDVRELAVDVAAQLGVLAEEKRQVIEIEGTSHPECLGDRLMLHQAFTNIVDNAIKYGPEGGRIGIHVSTTPTHAVIDVSDDGPGIDPSREAHIFERFYRGASSDSTAGAGLGLSIAKWAVEAAGGELKLHQSGHGGCTFRMTIPRAEAARARPARPAYPVHDDRLKTAV